MLWLRGIIAALLVVSTTAAQAFALQTEKVAPDIYALVGEIGPRSAENHALNNTMGFVVTPKGVVLVSTGASPSGARLIEAAIKRVTDQPIRWVINVGSQDHHWLGNSWFVEQGAKIIALAKTVASQKNHVDDHLFKLRKVIKSQADDIKPVYASMPINADHARFTLGGVQFELLWPGGGHFPGDAVLWLPEQKIVFTGDYVFLDRMLGIQPYSSLQNWQKSFKKIAALKPRLVIPGHGHPAKWAKAQQETGDYLDWLMRNIKAALTDWKEIGDTVNDLSEAPQFRHLKFYENWHRKNINRAYLQLEAAQG